LTISPVLGYADFSQPLILETDASQQGLGAVLSQERQGKRRVIAYASRRLRPPERNMDNYSFMKLEMLALKWAVTDKFRSYLFGSNLTVCTDNNPLKYLETAKPGSVEQRRTPQLASYRSGKSNANADGVSRLPRQDCPDMLLLLSVVVVTNTLAHSSNTTAFRSHLATATLEQSADITLEGPQHGQAYLANNANNTERSVLKSITKSFPSYSKFELTQMQQSEPTISSFLKFWRVAKIPMQKRRKTSLLVPVSCYSNGNGWN
jgi:hypothetical protein